MKQSTMEASHRKLPATVVLLLLTMAAETGPVQAKDCLSASAAFKGSCFMSEKRCSDKCLLESSANSGGKCDGFLHKCLCIRPCTAAETTAPPRTKKCFSDSVTHDGACIINEGCNKKCLEESSANTGGECSIVPHLKCRCIRPC